LFCFLLLCFASHFCLSFFASIFHFSLMSFTCIFCFLKSQLESLGLPLRWLTTKNKTHVTCVSHFLFFFFLLVISISHLLFLSLTFYLCFTFFFLCLSFLFFTSIS
jgi:hypothetical protein